LIPPYSNLAPLATPGTGARFRRPAPTPIRAPPNISSCTARGFSSLQPSPFSGETGTTGGLVPCYKKLKLLSTLLSRGDESVLRSCGVLFFPRSYLVFLQLSFVLIFSFYSRAARGRACNSSVRLVVIFLLCFSFSFFFSLFCIFLSCIFSPSCCCAVRSVELCLICFAR